MQKIVPKPTKKIETRQTQNGNEKLLTNTIGLTTGPLYRNSLINAIYTIILRTAVATVAGHVFEYPSSRFYATSVARMVALDLLSPL